MKDCTGTDAQVRMHKNFFDRCQNAIDQKYYMEAVLLEYAAIEGRMEVLMGLLGAPCNRLLPDKDRKDIQISHRLACAKRLFDGREMFLRSKLSPEFFEKLDKWMKKRNRYVHGLYKNELLYTARIKGLKDFSEKGLRYARLLYNEVKRLRRLPQGCVLDVNICTSSGCKLCRKEKKEEIK